jgi:hypothetical protein
MGRGGKRFGAGRRRGTTRQVIALNQIAAVQNTLHLKRGKSKPALQVLQELLDEALAIAAYYKPGPPKSKHADRALHERFLTFARDTAKELAKYQAPQLRSIAIAPPAVEEGVRVKRFTLTVFDNGRKVDRSVSPMRTPAVTHGNGDISRAGEYLDEPHDDDDGGDAA